MSKPLVVLACALSMLSGCAGFYGGGGVSARSDAEITAAVQARYAGDRTVNASAINVFTHNGVVVLSGDARNWTEKTVAEQVALKVDDVRTIKNNIVIRGDAPA